MGDGPSKIRHRRDRENGFYYGGEKQHGGRALPLETGLGKGRWTDRPPLRGIRESGGVCLFGKNSKEPRGKHPKKKDTTWGPWRQKKKLTAESLGGGGVNDLKAKKAARFGGANLESLRQIPQ